MTTPYADVFAAERAHHLEFFERRDLFTHLDHLLCEGAKWIVIAGTPGSGKSAIASNYLLRLETAGLGGHLRWARSWLSHGTTDKSPLAGLAPHLVTVKSQKAHRVVPQHFVRYGYKDWAVPSAVEQSLWEQVALLFPKLVDAKDKPPERLSRLLQRASADVLVPKHRRLILVIDGLDQMEGERATNPLFDFLPPVLPAGISVVCSTRPLRGDLAPLEAASPVRIDLDSPEWAESNFVVQMTFLKAHRQQVGGSSSYVDDAIKFGAGNLRYLHELLSLKAEYPRAPIDKVPPKFLAYLDELWRFISRFDDRTNKLLRTGLRSFAADDRWLSPTQLASEAKWPSADVELFLKAATPVLTTKETDDETSYQVFHPSFAGFIAAKQRDADILSMLEPMLPAGASLPSSEAEGPVTHRYGLVIGIDNYVENGLALRYCVNDAVAMGAKLNDLGYTTIALNDDNPAEDCRPTVMNLRGALASLKGRFGQNELLLVYFAGHGALVDGVPYLLARDSRTADIKNTGLPLADVERYMRESSAGRMVLILDACHAGVDIGRDASATTGTGIDPSVLHSSYELAEGFAVLAGSTAAQRAQDDHAKQHGVFTFYLLEALSGKADCGAVPRGFVTVDELKDYVLNAVRAWCFTNMAALQLPTARIEGVGDMIVAYLPKQAAQAA